MMHRRTARESVPVASGRIFYRRVLPQPGTRELHPPLQDCLTARLAIYLAYAYPLIVEFVRFVLRGFAGDDRLIVATPQMHKIEEPAVFGSFLAHKFVQPFQ